MKCTICNENVKIFSKELNKKPWKCPSCQKPVKLGYNVKSIILWMIPAIIISELVKTYLYSSGYKNLSFMVIGVSVAVVMTLNLQLKPVKRKNDE